MVGKSNYYICLSRWKIEPLQIDDSRQPLVSQSPPTRSRNGPVSYVSSGSSQQSSARAANRPYPYPLDANRSSSKSSRRFGKGSETPMDDRSSATITKAWDVFRLLPPPPDNFGKGFWNDVSLQILKISCFIILFLLTLTSAAVAKSLFLLMTSAIGWGGQTMVICNNKIPEGLTNYVIIEKRHTVKWIWAALLSLAAPELFCFCRSFHRSLFRNVKAPTFLQFLVVFIIESLHAVGVGMLVFHILPDLTATTGATLSSAMCLVPCVLTLLSRKPNKKAIVLIFFDVLCIIAQTSSYWVLPALSTANNQFSWLLPISLTLISLAWWQNFVHTNSALPPIQAVAKFANTLSERRSKTYVFVSLWKCAIYAICAFLFTSYRMPINNLFQSNPFGSKVITVSSLNMNQSQIAAFEDRMKQYETAEPSNFYLDNVEYLLNRLKGEDSDMHLTTENPLHNREGFARPSKRSAEWVDQPETADPYRIYEDKVELNQFTSPYDAFWVVVIQVFAVALCYHSSKFACKVMMQRSGFAFPIILSSPLTVAVLSSVCAQRSIHPCQLYSLLTKELFWRCDANLQSWSAFVKSPQTWMWACWLLSQFWVTIHLWRPKHERLAKTEKLFILSTYNGAFIDISLALNRRRDDKTKILEEDLELDSEDVSSYEMMSGRVHKSPPSLCSTVSSKVDTGLIR
ncbi:hypothetical protein AB6A40_006283 [Gnathostoma spinigerum]|uniref:Chitin synthase chs-1/2 N-terminal putative transporter domain-containing protein n=1 Tax=Gnathostoma spinigerum TaxID=75299 RepID=A0ABD6EHY5_9BILA